MKKLPAPGRMEAFSDGVIAVIITIMVLEFKVPKEAGAAGLLSLLPAFAVYALSFTFTGIYWVNHHYMVDRIRRVDALILWMNLLFLFSISLIPFFTEYVVAHQFDPFSVGLYAASMMLDGVAYTALSKAILRHLRQRHAVYEADEVDRHAAEQESEDRKGYLSVLIYVIAIPTARWHPGLGMALTAAVPVVWIVPGFLARPAAERGRAETSGA